MNKLRMNLQYFAESQLTFLKDALGDQFDAFEKAINTYNSNSENKDKQIKIGNLASGKYVDADKCTKAEKDRDTFKQQLADAQKTLEGFKDIDVSDLKGQIATLQGTIETNKTKYEQDLADRDFNDAVSKALVAAGAKNPKVAMATLDLEALKASKNRDTDLKVAIESSKKDNAYIYGANEPINNPVGPTDPDSSIKKLSEMSYEEYKAYRQGDNK